MAYLDWWIYLVSYEKSRYLKKKKMNGDNRRFTDKQIMI